ncbi:FAD-dependent 5-carboxymethylaminomethyl-2-thiouridine(34) oxidoreductase MnmC [Shewanella sp. AS1]|uniref:FAD-dependent 5-carboxymethylaminomethyl-2-thiouridine(34) oxidoreductase MnmC n=1 Tax=Shewanella sp. AS1 TaxID=2907626 RepID=UPI001F32AD25|nr:FAD-dependent 5-carboxymethylaminomethyl-2-thiouridine(34) oxidoreductase MnmC [Shewanella sp. AS1]MCE9679549.1 FAD-dependent 5-carboxymethylaminomethyl-2-thiouridine(34) oxidoreductase MnmC [Shewanella sp. AS1]
MADLLLDETNSQRADALVLIGKPSKITLLNLLTRLTQEVNATEPRTNRVKLHLFCENPAELLSLSKALTSWDAIACQLRDIGLCQIEGSHTLLALDGRFSLTIYLGKFASLLKQIPHPKGELCLHWLFTDPAALGCIDHKQLWQMARLSHSASKLCLLQTASQSLNEPQLTAFLSQSQQAGFTVYQCDEQLQDPLQPLNCVDEIDLEIAAKERTALRNRFQQQIKYNPVEQAAQEEHPGNIAIIGGGVASACLALSLAERGKPISLFCMDSAPGQQASGNKQGAIYPLLTPEYGPLSHFFLQGYLFSRQRIRALTAQGYDIAHDFCGVLQTPFDGRSKKRLDKIMTAQPWPQEIARSVDTVQAGQIAGIEIGQPGIFYPLGGWVSPQQLTAAAITKAASLTQMEQDYHTEILRIEKRGNQWHLYGKDQHGHSQAFGPFANLVLANGRHLTDYPQTAKLPISGFRGQVSHIPSRGQLTRLSTVLCAQGYLTPANEHLHCSGASYVKDPDNLDYSPTEQLGNLDKLRSSYQQTWVEEDVDISGHSARVGVRMVTRDHAPMMGCAPDFEAIEASYQNLPQGKAHGDFWQKSQAPIHEGLFILGGLGSRGLTSGPLAAEILAAQLCGELLVPLEILTLLNPNRMWMRKLVKGKAL